MDITVAMSEEALVFDATREMRERAEQYRQHIARLEALVGRANGIIVVYEDAWKGCVDSSDTGDWLRDARTEIPDLDKEQ